MTDIGSGISGGRVGKALGMEGMDEEKILALVYGTLSALMTAVHAVLVKNAVRTLEGSVLRLTYWSNLLSGAFLVRLSFLASFDLIMKTD